MRVATQKCGVTRIDKSQLIAQLVAKLEDELAAIKASAAASAEAATHAEAKPENKYDTRGLEASYLAGAQKERVAELQSLVEGLKGLAFRPFGEDDPLAPTALAELDHGGTTSLCLLLRAGAGYELAAEGRKVLTVSVASPLGKALLGKRVGDTATVTTAQGEKDYEILAAW